MRSSFSVPDTGLGRPKISSLTLSEIFSHCGMSAHSGKRKTFLVSGTKPSKEEGWLGTFMFCWQECASAMQADPAGPFAGGSPIMGGILGLVFPLSLFRGAASSAVFAVLGKLLHRLECTVKGICPANFWAQTGHSKVSFPRGIPFFLGGGGTAELRQPCHSPPSFPSSVGGCEIGAGRS